MHLSDCFLEFFTFIRYLADSPEMADADYATVRADISLLIKRLDARSKKCAATPEQLDMARFAVFAWADEAVLCSAWPGARDWLKHPLQREYYGTANAGEEFIARLHGLLGGRMPEAGAEGGSILAKFAKESGLEPSGEIGSVEVLEVFALCLALGYTGMYFSEADRGRLDQLRQDCVLRVVGKQASGVLSAFPQAYGSPKNLQHAAGHGRVFDPLEIVFALLPLLILTGIYFAYRGMLQYSLNLWFG